MCRTDLYVFLMVVYAVGFHDPTSAARILAVFPAPAKSHMTLGVTLLEALANEGHDVTMISPFPLDKPIKNYRDVRIQNFKKEMLTAAGKISMFDMSSQNPIVGVLQIHSVGVMMTKGTITDPEFLKVIHSDQQFDIVIIEIFLNEALIALGHKFNAPVVIVSPMAPGDWTNDLVGNPSQSSHVPNIFTGFSDRMTFKERLQNTAMSLVSKFYRHFFYIPKQEALVKEYFPGYPPLRSLMSNVSLVLLNSHISLTYAQPLVPNMIEIGGYHVLPPKPLPVDLQKLLDNAKEGVIYFSMGSNLESKELPVKKRDALLAVFKRIKHKVLWKWETEEMPGKPENVILNPWLPQRDILAHPNVKVFITHGGLLSSIESINRGVPVIGIPIYGDQHSNMKRAVSLGYGLMISYDNLTENSMSWALDEILNNPSYRENVKRRSIILRDQQVDPLKKAVWWIEYVIRHKGAKHLKNSAVDMPLYQYFLIDVIAFIVALVSILTFVPCCIIVQCCKRSGKTKGISKDISKKYK